VPEEWGGTETAVKQLLDGLDGVESVVYAPTLHGARYDDPGPLGHPVRRYRATLPVIGIPKERRRQLESVGGNILSLQLLAKLTKEPGLSVVHTHALNRIGGAALTAARRRGLPFVVTVHGGAMDLPAEVAESMEAGGGIEWGKAFGAFLNARRVLEDADAILTVNPREAELLRERYPAQRVLQTFHGVDLQRFASDQRAACPEFGDRKVVLVLGRVDPVKNQVWAAQQWGDVVNRHPDALLVFAGAATDEAYGRELEGYSSDSVRRLGGISPGDPKLVGLLLRADVVLIPSKLETFGLVAVEAWAAGSAVVASKTTGTTSLIEDGANGLLFDQGDTEGFHQQLDRALADADRLIAAGNETVKGFSIEAAAAPVKELYEELLEVRRCA
jgi:glycosyltransferase involved in cell wall biosynthesis